jgi:hypothetical protein
MASHTYPVPAPLDRRVYGHHHEGMNGQNRRVTANLPKRLLEEATQASGTGITEPIVRGLELVRRTSALTKARALKGKLNLEVDLDVSRERAGR